jgi:ribosomal protein S19
MKRNNWKGPLLQFDKKTSIIKTFSKNSMILPNFLGYQLEVYNGKTFLKINIVKEMIGFKVGEFVPTRKKFSFKKKSHGSKNKS